MKLIFMGSPAFALPTLEALLASGHEITCVYSQPPRKAKRNQNLSKTPVHERAEANDLEVRTPERLKGEVLDMLLAEEVDAIIVVAYGLLLPKILVESKLCINIHPSSLPRWRGAAPLQHTLLAGDTATEVCIMQLDVGMDTGPVFLRAPYAIDNKTTFGELHDEMAAAGANHLLEVLAKLPELKPVAQTENGATLAPKISKEMRSINWQKPATEIHNHVRGLSPFPSATLAYKGETFKVLRTQVSAEEVQNVQSGCIISAKNGKLVAKSGNGAIELLEMQRAGKKAMPASELMKSFTFVAGEFFE